MITTLTIGGYVMKQAAIKQANERAIRERLPMVISKKLEKRDNDATYSLYWYVRSIKEEQPKDAIREGIVFPETLEERL